MQTTNSPSTDSIGKNLSPNQWLAATIGLIAFAIAINILIAWRMDIYGIFRDPKGRALITSEHERKAKYLLNESYVPANYDALIIGSSASVNWKPEYFTGYRFYNESLEGGNASEEYRLVTQALQRGHFRLALVSLSPRITQFHLLQDGFDQARHSEALGSISSLGILYDRLKDRLDHRKPTFFPNGSHILPINSHYVTRGDHFSKLSGVQDEQAVADYQALAKELQDTGTRIVYVALPLYKPHYDFNADVMKSYMDSIRQKLPSAPFIDLNAPEYDAFCNDPSNFVDGVHLSESGAEKLSHLLDHDLHRILEDQ